MFSQLLSTIKVKIVDKTMQIANLCYFTCQAQKIIMSCRFNLIAHVRYIKHDSNMPPRFHESIVLQFLEDT